MTWPLATKDSGQEHLKTRLLLAATLLSTSVATILLLASNRAPWTNSGHIYNFVTSERATVQIIVQILSQSFGTLHVYALCSLINFATRLRLARIPHTLDQLQFWSAISLQRLDWALPHGLMMILILFHAVIVIPGAIWAGALTPVIMSTHSSSTALLEVPQYSPTSEHIWYNLTWLKPEPSVHNRSGIFSYSPNYDLVGLILTQAASASNIGNATQPVRKLDNTRYSYVGRSYGIGSSVGLVDESFAQNTTRGYTYNETGYLTQVQCIVNSTSLWAISGEDSFRSSLPDLYMVAGNLTNGNSESYAACGFGSPENITALVGSTGQDRSVFAIAAGKTYAALDKIQCTVDFIPAKFSVSVNMTERLITTELLANGSDVKDIDPTGKMKAITMRMPTSFSQQHACDLYTSLLGNTFTQNIQALINSTISNGSKANTTEQTLRGVQDSLTSMLDNSLLAFSSAQLMIPRDVYLVPVSLSSAAVRIGQSRYIYAVAAVNFAILLLGLLELIRTRVWKGLSRFDFTDVKSLVVGVAKGGTVIAEEAEKIHVHHNTGYRTDRSEDRALGSIRVRLESLGADSRLVGVGQKEEGWKLEKGIGEAMTWDQDENAGRRNSELEYLHREEGGRD